MVYKPTNLLLGGHQRCGIVYCDCGIASGILYMPYQKQGGESLGLIETVAFSETYQMQSQS